MSRVVHFELPTENPAKIAEFYRRILGWAIKKWDGPVDYWLISTGPENEPGINGGIARKQDRHASCFLVTAEVSSIDECLKKIVTAGGTITVPKRPIPGVGYQAHFRDPEGNIIGILQNYPSAK